MGVVVPKAERQATSLGRKEVQRYARGLFWTDFGGSETSRFISFTQASPLPLTTTKMRDHFFLTVSTRYLHEVCSSKIGHMDTKTDRDIILL
jgi:hypothetical protein